MTQDLIISKENIFENLQKQINALVQQYEDKINELIREKTNLQAEVEKLKIKVETLSLKLGHGNEQLKVKKDDSSFINPQQIISEYLIVLKQHAGNFRYDKCLKILLELNSFPSDSFGDQARKVILEFITSMFNYRSADADLMDKIFRQILIILQKFLYTNDVIDFIKVKSNLFNQQIVESNEPENIVELAKTYFCFHLTQNLAEYINILLINWEYIDLIITKKDFIRLLWYSFYLSLDKKLLQKALSSSDYLKENDSEISLYKIFYTIIESNIISDKFLGEIENYKKNVIYLNEFEIDKIFKSINKRLRKHDNKVLRANKQLGDSKIRKIWYVTKLPSNQHILPDTKIVLQEEWIQLTTFKDVFLNVESGYVKIQALSDNKIGKAYVTDNHIKDIKSKIGKQWVDVREYQGQDKIENKLTRNDINKNLFTWPSTEIKGTISMEGERNSQFNEESELKKLGYQITGLTRVKRWDILENAVKQLGLKKVAYTIAQNVKLRKGQKNGASKFSYAIGEWEYDLAKLKQKYYKGSSSWPTTNVK